MVLLERVAITTVDRAVEKVVTGIEKESIRMRLMCKIRFELGSEGSDGGYPWPSTRSRCVISTRHTRTNLHIFNSQLSVG